MPIELGPIGDVFVLPGACQPRRKLGSHFAGVAVSELVEDAAVFVKDAVIGVDQIEEFVTREEIRAVSF